MQRPISPHITIYRKQISSVLSILHRLTGIILFVGVCIGVWLFIVWVFSGFNFTSYQLLEHYCFRIMLRAASFAGFYHFCTGIRYLVWSTGSCMSVNAVDYTGWGSVICAVVFTILFWLFII